jgi:hypothetical protein
LAAAPAGIGSLLHTGSITAGDKMLMSFCLAQHTFHLHGSLKPAQQRILRLAIAYLYI